MLKIFLLFTLFSIGFGQQLINLSSFNGDDSRNELSFPAPYSIYISANSDSENILSYVFILNDEGAVKSLQELKDNKLAKSGKLRNWVIQKSAYLTTSLPTNQMKTLKGVMFISTPTQVQNINFHVIDLANAQNAHLQKVGAINSTILFLNTNTDSLPHHSATISPWQQDEDATVFIYPGIPLDTIEPKNTQIFSNPMHTDKFVKFFPTVEKFSVSMVAFYLKTYKGFDFRIEPGYYNIDKTTTSAYTTTGFYMKELSKEDSPVTITTIRDTKYSGSTGANIIGSLSTGAKVTVAEYGGKYDDAFTAPPNDFIFPWSTPNIGEIFSISSSPPGATGRYFVQYFVVQEQQTSGTTTKSVISTTSATTSLPGRQTTANPEISTTSQQTAKPGISSTSATTSSTSNPGIPTVNTTWHYVETTTKSSGTIQILVSLMISFMVFIGFY